MRKKKGIREGRLPSPRLSAAKSAECWRLSGGDPQTPIPPCHRFFPSGGTSRREPEDPDAFPQRGGGSGHTPLGWPVPCCIRGCQARRGNIERTATAERRVATISPMQEETKLPASGDQRPRRGGIVMNAKTICLKAEVQRTPVGQPALLWWGSSAALPLLVGHSHISGPGGQRLVSVLQ